MFFVLRNMARSTGHVANHERHTTAIWEKMKSQAHEKDKRGYRERWGCQEQGLTWPLAQVLLMCCTVSSATESGKIPAHSMVTTEYSSIPVRIKHHWLMQACPSREVSSNPHWTTSSHPPYRVMLVRVRLFFMVKGMGQDLGRGWTYGYIGI